MVAASGAGLASKSPGRGAFVPVKAELPPNLLDIFGLGRVVKRSEVVKAAERSAKDLGSSLTAGDVLLAEERESSEGLWALARIAAMSTLPTGS